MNERKKCPACGREERRRREDEHEIATTRLFYACNGWHSGKRDAAALRAAIERWRETGRAVEEGLDIQ